MLEQAKRLRPRTAPTPQRAHCSLSVRAAAADLINVGSPQRLKHPAPAPADANASRPASAGPSSSDAPLPALPDDEGLRMEGYSHHAREKLLSASKSATARAQRTDTPDSGRIYIEESPFKEGVLRVGW